MIKDGLIIKDKMNFQVGKGYIDGLKLSGHVVLELFDANGDLKDRREDENTVTTLALAMVANRLSDTVTIALPNWMEVGTGTGQGAGDSTLATYIAGSRTVLDSSTGAAAVLTMICTMGAGVGTGAITEAGVFNVVTQNTTDLILYDDFAVINKGAGDSLVITWTLTFS